MHASCARDGQYRSNDRAGALAMKAADKVDVDAERVFGSCVDEAFRIRTDGGVRTDESRGDREVDSRTTPRRWRNGFQRCTPSSRTSNAFCAASFTECPPPCCRNIPTSSTSTTTVDCRTPYFVSPPDGLRQPPTDSVEDPVC